MSNKKTVIDVRTPAEYLGGSVVGSVNIPLQELHLRVDEIKAMQQPIVLCCASGMRSQQATTFLKSANIDCENGGSWYDVNGNLN
ncbi:rhodanese-like domain-containing protein [Pedobacter alpinus]|uniref:Rhodanese-like domain-containing protein n=1 Tax=Pedobacter alpinus TaxID=1590643 RepID=A0ABW5TVR4_9SPHI